MNDEIKKDIKFEDENFQNWKIRWKERLRENSDNYQNYKKLMKTFNPIVIPRNHKVEEVLSEANQNNFEPLERLLEILKKPYNNQSDILDYQIPSSSNEKYQTFCGT